MTKTNPIPISTNEPPTTESQWQLGCKVPDHNGPLGEGWEANSQYHESIDLSRRTNPAVRDGNLDPDQFGMWTELAECLKDVLFLVEAQAYFKEVQNLPNRYSNGSKLIIFHFGLIFQLDFELTLN